MSLSSPRPAAESSPADAGGLEALGLDPTLLPKALALRDWLLTEAARLADPGDILPGLADRRAGRFTTTAPGCVQKSASKRCATGRSWLSAPSRTSWTAVGCAGR